MVTPERSPSRLIRNLIRAESRAMESPVEHEDARRVLDQVGVLRHRSDLDLLVFFARHPRTLLTSDQIATFLGYELPQIAASLERLLEAGYLTRTQNRAHAARLYVFSIGASTGGWLPELLKLGSTREGRLILLAQLSDGEAETHSEPRAHGRGSGAPSRVARPFLVRGGDATGTDPR
jgi:DNA-binding MarR family transcriptional regulator